MRTPKDPPELATRKARIRANRHERQHRELVNKVHKTRRLLRVLAFSFLFVLVCGAMLFLAALPI